MFDDPTLILHIQYEIAHIVTSRTSPVNLGFCRSKIRVSPNIVGEKEGPASGTFAMALHCIGFHYFAGFS